jgi:hypothetical protein
MFLKRGRNGDLLREMVAETTTTNILYLRTWYVIFGYSVYKMIVDNNWLGEDIFKIDLDMYSEDHDNNLANIDIAILEQGRRTD